MSASPGPPQPPLSDLHHASPAPDAATVPPPAGQVPSAEHAPLVYRSSDLLRGAQEILIVHGSETYRLRLTRFGKLILQK